MTMKKALSTLLFATAVCGLVAAANPAQARFYTTSSMNSSANIHLSRMDVMSLQTSLANRGFYTGSIDGIWGPRTTAALTAFESSRGLNADGMADRETLALLGVSPGTSVSTASTVSVIEPAAGYGSTTFRNYDTIQTRTTGGFVSINVPHVNGSTCLTCTNGIIGNGGTPSMPSNAY
jgi:peptidoglycan hydrolase-like protein with peptidoglycan-binding domain